VRPTTRSGPLSASGLWERFARTVEMARRNLEGEIFPVCFCYRARPEVQERIRELGFRLVFSYGELV